MKRLLSLVVFLSLFYSLSAQDFPSLYKYPLGESGFQAYLPAAPDNAEPSLSEDGSTVWTAEVEGGEYLFGAICVVFSEPLGYDAELNTELLESYLDYLQAEVFYVIESAGYGYGHTLESSENAVGILDYWVDAEGYTWKIKGWVSNSYMVVLYVGGGDEDPNEEAANMFLNGVRFPSK